jgi:hypothetical protein
MNLVMAEFAFVTVVTKLPAAGRFGRQAKVPGWRTIAHTTLVRASGNGPQTTGRKIDKMLPVSGPSP